MGGLSKEKGEVMKLLETNQKLFGLKTEKEKNDKKYLVKIYQGIQIRYAAIFIWKIS